MSLGMEDGRIHDAAISASTIANNNHAAKLGRLNLVASSGNAGAWCVKTNNNKQWLQIDLGTPTTVTRVATQGRQDSSQWVTYQLLAVLQPHRVLLGSVHSAWEKEGNDNYYTSNFCIVKIHTFKIQ